MKSTGEVLGIADTFGLAFLNLRKVPARSCQHMERFSSL